MFKILYTEEYIILYNSYLLCIHIILFYIFQGTPCDLVTGEERKFADEKNEASKHVSCTVEMANVNTPCM